jgi:hypothetical protein
VKVWVSWRRWSDGKLCESTIEEHELFKLKGDALAVVRSKKGSESGPDPRAVAARAFGQARKL